MMPRLVGVLVIYYHKQGCGTWETLFGYVKCCFHKTQGTVFEQTLESSALFSTAKSSKILTMKFPQELRRPFGSVIGRKLAHNNDNTHTYLQLTGLVPNSRHEQRHVRRSNAEKTKMTLGVDGQAMQGRPNFRALSTVKSTTLSLYHFLGIVPDFTMLLMSKGNACSSWSWSRNLESTLTNLTTKHVCPSWHFMNVTLE